MLAIGAMSASVAAARPLSKLPLPLPRSAVAPGELSCGIPGACALPEPDARERLVHAQLASRVSGLSERDRLRLGTAIVEEAALGGLDPLFVLAVIGVESAYDPDALSRRGARGLMQLRTSTLRREVALWRLPGDDPGDPVLNVKAGVRYYRRLLRVFRKQDLALMAYNAGPNRISGYLKSGRVPDRFRAYPRRVRAELKRLREVLAMEPRLASVAARERQTAVE